MKKEMQSDYFYRKSENLPNWIKKFEDHCMESADIDDEIKEYIEYSMKVFSEERKDFYDNYLYNLDNNLNVFSSKNNYQYLDFFKSPDPYAPLDKDLFKNVTKMKN